MSLLPARLRVAGRGLLRQPGFFVGAAGTLALGLALAVTAFAVVDGVLLRPLPYPDAGRVVSLWSSSPTQTGQGAITAREGDQIVAATASFTASAYYYWGGLTYLGGKSPQLLTQAVVSPGFFAALGTAPERGRALGANADGTAPAEVVVGHAFWQTALGGDPDIVGKPLRFKEKTLTVVGVMPPEFTYPSPAVALWTPLDRAAMRADVGVYEHAAYLSGVARLRADATFDQAAAELASRSRRVEQAERKEVSIVASPILDDQVGAVRPMLWMLLGLAVLVLLIATTNVANLCLARGIARLRELAVRKALGATRGDLLALTLGEGAWLAGAAAVLGAAGASAAIAGVQLAAGEFLPRAASVTFSPRVALVAAGLATLVSLLASALPALRLQRLDVQTVLRQGGARQVGLRGGWLGAALPTVGVAVSVVALTAALVLTASVFRLSRVGLGFVSEGRGAVQFWNQDAPGEHRAFLDQLLVRAAAIPGVARVGVASALPLLRPGWYDVDAQVEERTTAEPYDIHLSAVGGDYFGAMGIALRAGRLFDDTDGEHAPKVVLVSETFARRAFKGASPLGRTVRLPTLLGSGDRWPAEIVGVVADVHVASPAEAPEAVLYVPYAQQPLQAVSLVLAGRPGVEPDLRAAERAVWSLHPDLGIFQTVRFADTAQRMRALPRLYSQAALLFAGLAAVLTGVGLYALLAFLTRARTRELALRLALGALPAQVLRLVLRRGFRLLSWGAGIGLAGSAAAFAVLRATVYGVGVGDAWMLLLGLAGIAGVALAAYAGPARRAARLHPMVALREE